MNRTKHKILTGVITVALLLQTAMPSVALSAEPAPKTIAGICSLEQTEYNLPIGAEQAAIGEMLATFPKTITAEVEYFVTEEVTQPPAPPMVDNGKPEMLPEKPVEPPVTEETPAPDETPAVEEIFEVFVSGNTTEKPMVASDSNIPEKAEEPTVTGDEKEDTTLMENKVTEEVALQVTWISDKPLTTEKEDTFTYTAKLSDDDKGRYELAAGVALPSISVTVAASLMTMAGSTDWTAVTLTEDSKVLPEDRVEFSKALPGSDCAIIYLKVATDDVAYSIQPSGDVNTEKGVQIFSFDVMEDVTGEAPEGMMFSYWKPAEIELASIGGIKTLHLKPIFILSDPVASRTINGVTTYHDNLQDALSASDDKTISVQLLKDVELNAALSVGGAYSKFTVTLDLNGHTITTSLDRQTISIRQGINFTLEDTSSGGSGAVKNTYESSSELGLPTAIYNTGTFTIKGGVVDAREGGYGITNINEEGFTHASVTIAGGVILEGSLAAIFNISPMPVTMTKGLILGSSLNSFSWSCVGDMTLPVDASIPAGKTLAIRDGGSLTVPNGVTLMLDGGAISGGSASRLVNHGTLRSTTFNTAAIQGVEDRVYTGSMISFTPTTAQMVLGNAFAVDTAGYVQSWHKQVADGTWAAIAANDIKEVGKYKLVYTEDIATPNTVEKLFNILPSGTEYTGSVKAYGANDMETTTFAYGDTIKFQVIPAKVTAPGGRSALTPPASGELALFVGDTQITQPQTNTGGSTLTFTYDTKGTNIILPNELVEITAKYVSTGAPTTMGSVTVTVTSQAELVISGNAGYWSTVQAAIDQLPGGETGSVKLMKDVDLGTNSLRIPSANRNCILTLDLNGKTLTSQSNQTLLVAKNDTVTLQDSAGGGILTNTKNSSRGISNVGGAFTMKSGTVSVTGASGTRYCVYGSDGGRFTMEGGVLDARAGTAGIYTLNNPNNASSNGSDIIMSGGVIFTSGTAGSYAINNASTTAKVTATGGLLLGDCTGNGTDGLGWTSGGDVTLRMNAEIPSGKTFTVKAGYTLTIAQGITLTNNGIINAYGTLNYGADKDYGEIMGSGSMNYGSTAVVTMLDAQKNKITTATYDDAVTLRVEARTAGASSFSLMRAFSSDKAVFYLGSDSSGTKLGEVTVSYDSATQVATAELALTLTGSGWNPSSGAVKSIYVEFGGITAGKLLDCTATASFTIKPSSTVTPYIEPIAPMTFTGAQLRPAPVVRLGSITLTEGTDYTVSYGENINAGANAGSVTVTLRGSHSGTETIHFTINKAVAPSVSAPSIIPMAKEQVKAYTFDLSTLAMPQNAGAKAYAVAAPSNARLFTVPPTVNGSTLHFTSVNALAGEKSMSVVTITSDNYEPTTVTLTFEIISQIPVTISGVTVVSKSYNGTAVSYTDTPIATDGANTVTVSGYDYTWSTAAGATLTEAPKAAGDYRLTVSVKANDTQYIGSLDVPFSINKATVTIKADDKNALVGNARPALTYVVGGLAPSERLKTEPSLTTNANMNNAGSYPITASGAAVLDGGNYHSDIAYTHGTLTVSTSGGGTGGSGNSGSGDKDAPSILPQDPAKPNLPTTAETNISSKTNNDGKATAVVEDKTITSAIDKAQKEAKKNGTEKNGIAITLNVKMDKNASSLEATLSSASMDALIKAGVSQVTLKNDLTTMTHDLVALNALKGGDVVLTITRVDVKTLSAEAQKAIGNRPVFRFGATVGGKAIIDFKGGRVGLQMPYTRTTTEQSGNLVGVYVDAGGKVTWMENSSFDPLTDTLLTSTTHFSMFGVGYKAATSKFTDVGTHWAKNDIDFVVARGLLAGISNTTFAPDTSMTRGMFVTALGRLAGVDTKKYTSTKFNDVKADAYYAPYVEWASTNSIVNGTVDTTFSPDKAITRQEMSVMLVNYSKAIGYKMPSVHAAVSFVDAGSIGDFAKDAVKQTQMAGILMGKSGNRFDPTATATRAEVSAMLRRYVELVVSTETAEGWSINESGQWMYIQDGKRTTGKKSIDGKSYTFDQYGVTTSLPPERKYLTYTVQMGDSFWSIAWKHKVSMFELAAVNGKTIFSTIYAGDELKVPQ